MCIQDKSKQRRSTKYLSCINRAACLIVGVSSASVTSQISSKFSLATRQFAKICSNSENDRSLIMQTLIRHFFNSSLLNKLN